MGKCEYCGKSTPFKMPLCKEHYDMQQAGTLKKDTYGKWILTKPKKEIKEEVRTTDITYEKCIVCGANSNGRPQCPDCYDETKEYMDEIDKNSDVSKLREHYYHLKDYIFRLIPTKNLKNIKSNCNRLISIAIANHNFNKDFALSERVYNDVSELIKNKQKWIEEQSEKEDKNIQPKEEIKTTEEPTKYYFAISEDGHALDSDMEVLIDNALYNKEILHCVHKPVTDICEKDLKCDWFIPIKSVNEGIYIEYWGRNDKNYIERKNEKIRLYQKYNLPLIQIRKDEPKHNSQLFLSNLIRSIQNLAIKEFGYMPKWCNPSK